VYVISAIPVRNYIRTHAFLKFYLYNYYITANIITYIYIKCECLTWEIVEAVSGGSRNLERGVQLRVHKAHPKIFGLPRPLPDVNTHVIIVATAS